MFLLVISIIQRRGSGLRPGRGADRHHTGGGAVLPRRKPDAGRYRPPDREPRQAVSPGNAIKQKGRHINVPPLCFQCPYSPRSSRIFIFKFDNCIKRSHGAFLTSSNDISVSNVLAILVTSGTTSAFPIQKYRIRSGMTVFVQPSGKPFNRSQDRKSVV